MLDRFLTPKGLEGVAIGGKNKSAGNNTCTPAVPAIREANGTGIVSAVELAAVRSPPCLQCTVTFWLLEAIHVAI